MPKEITDPAAPKTEREQDRLGRWKFSRAIFEELSSTPRDWPVRIGIYGSWGSGKTTVLKYIEKQAGQHNHPTAWLNTWGCNSGPEIWNELVESLSKALGLSMISSRIRQLNSEVTEFQKHFSNTNLTAKAFDLMLGFGIRHVNQSEREQIKKALIKIGEKRLILLVDDLDRSTPEQIPVILYLLREVLDLPNIGIVIALDKNIVSQSIRNQNPAWDLSYDFLERIIDSHNWIPEPLIDQRLALVNGQLENMTLKVEESALRVALQALPSNPRTIIQFTRNLSRLKPIVERHEDNELNWVSIFLSHILDLRFPGFVEFLNESHEIKNWIAMGWVKKRYDKPAEVEKNEKQVREVVAFYRGMKNTGLQDSDANEVMAILHLWRDHLSEYTTELLTYHMNLFRNPPLITWREFNKFFLDWKKKPELSTAEGFIERHSAQFDFPKEDTLREFFETSAHYRDGCLSKAADSKTQEELTKRVEEADLTLLLLKKLSIEAKGFATGLFTARQFEIFYGTVTKWAHFRKPSEYGPIRDSELQLLEEVIGSAPQYAREFIDVVKPWVDHGYPGEPGPHIRNIQDSLAIRLQEEIAVSLIDQFKKPDGLLNLRGSQTSFADAYVAFREKSPLFADEKLFKQFKAVALLANSNSEIQKNFLQFMGLLEYGHSHGLRGARNSDLEGILKNKELMKLVWEAATCNRIQYRMLKDLEDDRTKFNSLLGEEILTMPDWTSKDHPDQG